MTSNRLDYIVGIAVLASLYYVTGRLGTLLAIPPGVVTVIWPPSGVALALLLLKGKRLWPGIFIGSVGLNLSILAPQGAPLWSTALVAMGIAAGSSLQAWLGARLISRLVGRADYFGSSTRVIQFVGVEMASCLVAATVGTASLGLGGFSPWSSFGETWLTWWLGDAVGILVVAPLILVWARRPFALRKRGSAELVFWLLAVFTLSQLIFGFPFPGATPHYRVAYLFLPLILWISFRLGLRGGVTAVFLTSVLAVCGTIKGTAPFAANSNLHAALLAVQLYVAVTAITGLALGAALSDRKRLDEEKGRMLAAEKRLRLDLARSNEELERFARIASHDLREPLRTIHSHLGLLVHSVSHKLSEDEKISIRFVQDGCERMQRLIKSLLSYSMPGAAASDFAPVPCDAILNAVLANCESAIDEAGAEVTSDPLPVIHGDGVQIEQLFQNLIGNALKYHNGVSPRVHVSAKEQNEAWLFSVKDNGIGIDMKYAERIFQAFERLHATDEYPGSGLGLSVCHKIVTQHGGHIWVESTPGEGSNFFFTIPLGREA